MDNITRPTKRIDNKNDGPLESLERKQQSTEHINEIEAERLQCELKTRMKLLDKLAKEGHNTDEIKDLKVALKTTIKELDAIIGELETDTISEVPA